VELTTSTDDMIGTLEEFLTRCEAPALTRCLDKLGRVGLRILDDFMALPADPYLIDLS